MTVDFKPGQLVRISKKYAFSLNSVLHVGAFSESDFSRWSVGDTRRETGKTSILCHDIVMIVKLMPYTSVRTNHPYPVFWRILHKDVTCIIHRLHLEDIPDNEQ